MTYGDKDLCKQVSLVPKQTQVRSLCEVTTKKDAILKVTIALSITPLALVSCSLSQDFIIINCIIMFFFSLGTVIRIFLIVPAKKTWTVRHRLTKPLEPDKHDVSCMH